MVTCHLTKLETALDQFRKSYPKLKPADAGLLASALTLTGRHALALYEGNQFRWPEDYDKLTKAMVGQLEMVQQGIEHTTKKVSKSAPEEEPVVVTVGLAPNISAGEDLLEGRDDLKALLGEVIQSGVEFVYSGMDLGWQWALDRVNWNTISGGELSRRIKIKAAFTEGAVGLEMGTGTKKRSSKKAAGSAVVEADASEDAKTSAFGAAPAATKESKAEAKRIEAEQKKAEAAAKKEAEAKAKQEAAAKKAEEAAAKKAEAAAKKEAEAKAKQEAAAKKAAELLAAKQKAQAIKEKEAAKKAAAKEKEAAKKAAAKEKEAAKKAAALAKKAAAAKKPAAKAAKPAAKKGGKPAPKSSKKSAAPDKKGTAKKPAVAVKKASAPAKKTGASSKKAGPTRKK